MLQAFVIKIHTLSRNSITKLFDTVTKNQKKTMWKFIAPDKPIRTTPDFFDMVDENWFVESKIDGWRCEIGNFNKIHTISRHNKPLTMNPSLIEELMALIPNNSAIDVEFINHDRIKAINKINNVNLPLIEKIIVIDVIWHNGVYLKQLSLTDRIALDVYKNLPTTTMEDLTNPNSNHIVKVVQTTGNNVKEFYNTQRKFIISEGVVLKKKNSKMIGGAAESSKNPAWYKVKYRNDLNT